MTKHQGKLLQTSVGKQEKNCPFCEYDTQKESTKILDMEFGAIYLNYNQSYLGRCLYIPSDHFDSFDKIPMETYLDFSREVFLASEYIKKAVNADLINIAMLCNVVNHTHWHIIPRFKNDSNWGAPPWPNQPKKISKHQAENLKKSITEAFL